MAGLNRVLLIGNVGKEPEITHTNSGMTLAKLSLATSDGMKDKNTGQTKTEWHRLIAFNKTAELIQKYVKKGSTLSIEGSISYGKYDNKDGVTVYTTDIIINNLVFLDKKEGGNNSKPAPQKFDVGNSEMDLGSLPF